MNKLEIIFFFIIISAFFMAVESNAEQSYVSDDYLFSVKFPDEWQVSGGHTDSSLVKAVFRTKEDNVAMVSILAHPLSEDSYFDLISSDPEMLAMNTLKQYEKLSPELISAEKAIIDHHQVVKMKLVMPLLNSKRIMTMYLIPKQHYLLTISVGADESIYTQMEPVLQKIVLSVDLKEKALKLHQE